MPTGFVRRSLSVLTAAALAVALCASPADAWPSQSPPSRTVGGADWHERLPRESAATHRVERAGGDRRRR